MRPPARPGVEAKPEAEPAAPQTPADGMKEYLARLVKLIPTEVVGLYMVGTGILQQTAKDDKVSWLVWAIICFILVIVVRVFGTSDAKNKVPPEIPLVIISAVSFVIWLYSLGGQLLDLWHVTNKFAWMAVLVWTFVIPFIYKQQPQ
jgi:hypothetical protein